MKKIVITGATSFIGRHLIHEMNNKNYKIYAVIRKNSNKKELINKINNIEIIELDMENIDLLDNYIKEECDTFYHFAWNGTRKEERDNKDIQMQNVSNSLKALEMAKKLHCKSFFAAGSQAEYGIQNEKVNEESICNPLSEYGKSKLEFYNKAKEFCVSNNIRLIEPRFFSLYGPYDNPNTLIMSSIKKMQKNENVELSSCKQLWNFLYIKDAVNLLLKIEENENLNGIFNFASKNTLPLKKFVLELKKILNSSSKIIFNNCECNGINPDITKIQKIGFKEKYDFKKGIKEILGVENEKN